MGAYLFIGDNREIGEVYFKAVGFVLPHLILRLDPPHLRYGFGVIQHGGMAHNFYGFVAIERCADARRIAHRKMPAGTGHPNS